VTALNPANGVFAPKETIVSPGTPRRGATGSNAIVKRGKSKFLLPEFGVDLKELISRYNSVRGIPFVLFDCLNYLLDEKGAPHNDMHVVTLASTLRADMCVDASSFDGAGALDNMRLFTAPVRDEGVSELRALLEQGGSVYEVEKDAYAVVEVVKQFLRELPDPLCTAELVDQWIAAASTPTPPLSVARVRFGVSLHVPHTPGQPTAEERKQAMKRIVFVQLPETNRVVLHFLLSFLYLYALIPTHSTKNKANVAAISDTFGPLVFRAPAAVPQPPGEQTTATSASGASSGEHSPTPSALASPRSGHSAILSRSAPQAATPQASSSSVAPNADAPIVRDVSPELARVLCQTLLEDLPTMFPLLPSMCPSLAYVPIFGLPLPYIMQAQAEKHPALKIPHFIHQGTHALSHHQ
jgi:hypothetical protein